MFALVVCEQQARSSTSEAFYFDSKMKFISELLVRHSGVQPSGHTGFIIFLKDFPRKVCITKFHDFFCLEVSVFYELYNGLTFFTRLNDTLKINNH